MMQQGGLLEGTISTYYFFQNISTLYLVINLVDQNSRGVHEWVLIIVTVPPAWRMLSRAPCDFFNISHQFAAFFSIKYLYSVPTCVNKKYSFYFIPYIFWTHFGPFLREKNF